MKTQKENKYRDFYLKIEKYKSALKFKFFCNNLTLDDFDRSSPGFFKANFRYKYRDVIVYCSFKIPEGNINSFLRGKRIPNVKVHKYGEIFHTEVLIIDEAYSQYLNIDYEKIPQKIVLRKKYRDKETNAKAKITIICDKKTYTEHLKIS